MSPFKRSVVGLIVGVALLMSAVVPAFAVARSDNTWYFRFPVHILCEGDPGYCSCSTC